jgi:phospholipid/cholesterol/gamma-HCH transport system permease protein
MRIVAQSPSAPGEEKLSADIQVERSGDAVLVFRGRLDAESVSACWGQLHDQFYKTRVKSVRVDASGLTSCDNAGLGLLRYLDLGMMTPGAAVSVVGLDGGLVRLFREFAAIDAQTYQGQSLPHKWVVFEQAGRSLRKAATDFSHQLEFLGRLLRTIPHNLIHRKSMRWPEVRRVFELAGADAVPIVSLVSFLVGLIIAFESAQPLAQFGAQVYVVNMIGLVMVREMGPLMAAILLAGRSASAFAAELGTMKVNEELNALETFGLDPIRFLVAQRIVAGVLLTPLLTFYSIFMGVVGGILVSLSMSFPLSLIAHQLTSSVHMGDIFLGASKGLVFGVIVSSIGCLRGLQTSQGPSAVGASTTRAVVTSILLIIIADAVFSIVVYSLKQ